METKTLKISASLHRKLKKRADELGLKMGRMCEVFLMQGLEQSDQKISKVVGSTKLPKDNT